MTTCNHQETSAIKSSFSNESKRLCFIAASVLALCAVYLLCGSALHLLAEEADPPGKEEWTFAGSILFAVIIGSVAFVLWFFNYRILIRSRRMACASCHHDLANVACPECGKTRENPIAGMSNTLVMRDRLRQYPMNPATLRIVRFVGASSLSLAALYLLLGGIYQHIHMPLIRMNIEHLSNRDAKYIRLYGYLFEYSVAVAVLIGLVGFCIWFIPYRRLARAIWLCPSCHYDLSGVPCPKCDAPDATERAAEHAEATP